MNEDMKNSNNFTVWDDDFRRKYWTAEEIAESQEETARIGEIIEAEQNGDISHKEALIKHLMLDPDLAENLLEDAYETGGVEGLQKAKTLIKEARNMGIMVAAAI